MTVFALSSFISLAITLFVLVRLMIDSDHSIKSKHFIVSVALTALCMLFYGVADLLEVFSDTPVPYIAYLLVLVVCCLTLHQRCIYSLEAMGQKGPDEKYVRFGLLILYFGVAIFVVSAVISSGFSDNIVFSIVDHNLKAERFWYVVYGIFFFPAVVMAIAAIVLSRKKKNYAIRSECIYVAIYLLSAVLPALYNSPIDLMSLFGAFFTLIYYTNHLRSKVTMDEITHISNRTLIIKKLTASIETKNTYFFLIKVDNFRKLNDAYGYQEGDSALIRIADTLKSVAPRNIIVGRLSGGEFAMLGELPSEEAAKELCLAVYDSLKKKNGKEEKDYKVTVSIGFTECGKEELKNVPDIMKAAEESLEDRKEADNQVK